MYSAVESLQLKTLKAPVYVHFELTRHCNLQCFYCTIRDNSSQSVTTLPLRHFEKIIDKLAESEVFDVSFFGGEPFLSPYIYELAKYAKDKGMGVGVITNGFGIAEKDIEKIPELFDAAGFALNGPRQIHDKLVGVNGAYDRTLTNIKRLSEKKFKIAINTLICKSNVEYLDSFLLWIASELKVSWVNINIFYSYGGLRPDETLDLKTLHKVLAIMDQHNKTDLKDKMNLGGPIPYCIIPPNIPFNEACSAGWMYGGIDIYGNVRICPWSSEILGNILDTPLSDIWQNSEKLKYYRESSWMDSSCDGCSVRSSCGGGCKVTSSPNPPYSLPVQWKPYVNSKIIHSEEISEYEKKKENIHSLIKDINHVKLSPNPKLRIRKEEKGFSIYVPGAGAYWLNDSAIEIYYLLCREGTMNGAIKTMCKEKNANLITIENDVKQVLYKLYNMNFFDNNEETEFKMSGLNPM